MCYVPKFVAQGQTMCVDDEVLKIGDAGTSPKAP